MDFEFGFPGGFRLTVRNAKVILMKPQAPMEVWEGEDPDFRVWSKTQDGNSTAAINPLNIHI